MQRRRLDAELVRRGLVESRTEAQRAIEAGLVTIDGAPGLKPATQVASSQALVVTAPPRAYVSRGGDKLAYALDRFGIDPTGRRCLDAGVSTGGFTDCLLQRGADQVLAYDVGYGQVHERLRTDPRVTVNERTNVRDLRGEDVPPPRPDLLVADLSFISLAAVLPTLRELVAGDAEAVLLVKPQFEAGRAEVGKGGVVRDPQVWRRCLEQVVAAAAEVGWLAMDAVASPLLGPAGNVEFLVYLLPQLAADGSRSSDADGPRASDPSSIIERAVAEGEHRRAGEGETR